jgi:hypothetical protein
MVGCSWVISPTCPVLLSHILSYRLHNVFSRTITFFSILPFTGSHFVLLRSTKKASWLRRFLFPLLNDTTSNNFPFNMSFLFPLGFGGLGSERAKHYGVPAFSSLLDRFHQSCMHISSVSCGSSIPRRFPRPRLVDLLLLPSNGNQIKSRKKNLNIPTLCIDVEKVFCQPSQSSRFLMESQTSQPES